MKARYFLFLAAALQAICFSGPIETLQPGEWYEVPNSHMSAVDPCPTRAAGTPCAWSAVEGQNGVMDDWCGGAFDTKRNNLIVWGGGHSGYAGNEVYTFSLDSLKWSRVSSPSDPPAKDVAYAPDGGPCSRHTYDYIQYVPATDRFCSFGGAGFYQSGQTGTSNTDAFNFSNSTWSNLGVAVPQGGGNSIGSFSAMDPATGHAWYHSTTVNSVLAEYDPLQNKWTNHGASHLEDSVGWITYSFTAAIDPVRKKMFAVGGGSVFAWNISAAGSFTGQSVATTGGSAVVSAANPGLEYDGVSGKLVAWASGQNVYTLDPATMAWTQVTGGGANPGSPNSRGTYGRFRYCPSKNVFVVVNSVSADVFIFRLTAGTNVEEARRLAFKAPVLQVSPNPFRGDLTIKGISSRYRIFDLQGKLVADVAPASSKGTQAVWHAGSLPGGIYFVKTTENGRVFNRRVTLLK